MIFAPQHGMSGADAIEYLEMLGVQTNRKPQDWEVDARYCELVDAASGAMCTLLHGHSDRVHRDTSDPACVLSWAEVPDLVVVGGSVDADDL